MVGKLDPVDDLPQFLEAAPYLGALAGHGFQKQGGCLPGVEHPIQRIGDKVDSLLRALAHMRARMHVVVLSGRVFHALQIVGQGCDGEPARFGLGGCRVEGVGGMRKDPVDAMFGAEGLHSLNILSVDGLRLATARVAGEELPGGATHGNGILRHMQIALRAGKMAPDVQHAQHSPFAARGRRSHSRRPLRTRSRACGPGGRFPKQMIPNRAHTGLFPSREHTMNALRMPIRLVECFPVKRIGTVCRPDPKGK